MSKDLRGVVSNHNRVLSENEQGVVRNQHSTIDKLNKETINNQLYKF